MTKYPTAIKTKSRTIITEDHLLTLTKHFESDPRPSKDIRAQLAKQLGLSEESIRIWFQNRRTKARSTGEIPTICRDHGNRFATSNQTQPIITPSYSPQFNSSVLTMSPTSLSPSFPMDFNYTTLPISFEPSIEFFPNDYSQFPLPIMDFTNWTIDNILSNEELIQNYLASFSVYPSI